MQGNERGAPRAKPERIAILEVGTPVLFLLRNQKPRGFAACSGAILSATILLSGCSHTPSPRKAANSVVAAAAARERSLQEARAAAAARDATRQELDAIPLPSKSMYAAIHTRQSWANPFLIVSKSALNLSILYPPMGPSGPSDTFLRPVGARRRVLDLRLSDLPEALTALPPDTWPYGRVIAVEEDPMETRQDRPAVRRNVEATMQMLSDLGVVAYEWQTSGR